MQRHRPQLVLLLGNVAAAIIDAVTLLGANSQRIAPGVLGLAIPTTANLILLAPTRLEA